MCYTTHHDTNSTPEANLNPSPDTYLAPAAPPTRWLGEDDLPRERAVVDDAGGTVAEGERLPLCLADCATAARDGGLGGERSDTRARDVVELGSLGDMTGLGREDASGGGEETARMPFFFWRTLAILACLLERYSIYCRTAKATTRTATARPLHCVLRVLEKLGYAREAIQFFFGCSSCSLGCCGAGTGRP